MPRRNLSTDVVTAGTLGTGAGRRATASSRPLLRRRVALGVTLALLGAGMPATGAPVTAAPPSVESGPPAVTPADIQFRDDTLRPGSAREVGLLPGEVDRLPADLAAYLQPTPDHPGHPTYAGAVVLAAKDGVIVQHAAVGTAVRYAAVGPAPGLVGVELPADQQIPMRPDTIFDMASVSKLFTAIVTMQLVERGRVGLDTPVAHYVPEFAAGGKETVTVRMLLTHTSGLPAFTALWSRYPTPAERIAATLATPLTAPPDTRYIYSDLGLITLGVLLERVTGRPLAELVRDGVTGPLGMTDTGYNPGPELRSRIAATEYQPYAGRGMVWGEVHDENAWSLGGVAGHAGIFSTAADLAVLCQALLNGGTYRGQRILRDDTVRAMLVNYNARLESADPESRRGLGFELNKHWYMMGLSSPVTFGHTGFTGTSIVIDPLSHSFVILLSNRVHPDRGWGSNNIARRAVARDLAEAMPVRPRSREAWRADPRDRATSTLTAPLRRAARGGTASFLLWYDTEPRYDSARFEVSTDGGHTWAPGRMLLHQGDRRWTSDGTVTGYGGRVWWQVTVELPDQATHLRWSSTTDSSSQGRGVYVDQIIATDRDGVLFHGEGGDDSRLIADGWSPARD
ncbi:serine hydrolase domain-containing protein [Micromonospora sagamiensis]|uniref:CubicO group peptidase (Beta-lactamase class C family) n=1 Tax=Micromonospora sagamiensis TaxID=47875 RepID=A0A562WED1_9ACTN|nr:serine hydrolase domain-containing protein [Micromonospora sagamiensis]TWJ28576.1 CubicO group peptidase (beta-lactamase class C family) [Micromonospora sagamiensis]BCL12521.1 serine hydrolase [Micromonospora sagamiensis]